MPRRQVEGASSEARQASDVMAFGQEIGRVLSDGRIVGRAEPYAKVFASSRAVKRAVGLTAWAVLEDIALDARLDQQGRLVAETNVRRIAGNLGLGKNAVSRHLAKLRDFGFVLHEEMRDAGSGRYDVSRYVLDPSACIERFTHTPGNTSTTATTRTSTNGGPHGPRPLGRDTGRGAVSPSAGHREQGQKNKRTAVAEEQHLLPGASGSQELPRRLTELGVDAGLAEQLAADHPADLVEAALHAASRRGARSPAGFVVSALRQGWDLAEDVEHVRRVRAREVREQREALAQVEAREHAERERYRSVGWAAVVSAALSDDQLQQAADRLTQPLAGLGRRSLPVVRAQLIAWAVTHAAGAAAADVPSRLDTALRDAHFDVDPERVSPLPEPPAAVAAAECLSHRLHRCVLDLDFPATPATKGLDR